MHLKISVSFILPLILFFSFLTLVFSSYYHSFSVVHLRFVVLRYETQIKKLLWFSTITKLVNTKDRLDDISLFIKNTLKFFSFAAIYLKFTKYITFLQMKPPKIHFCSTPRGASIGNNQTPILGP